MFVLNHKTLKHVYNVLCTIVSYTFLLILFWTGVCGSIVCFGYFLVHYSMVDVAGVLFVFPKREVTATWRNPS